MGGVGEDGKGVGRGMMGLVGKEEEDERMVMIINKVKE